MDAITYLHNLKLKQSTKSEIEIMAILTPLPHDPANTQWGLAGLKFISKLLVIY